LKKRPPPFYSGGIDLGFGGSSVRKKRPKPKEYPYAVGRIRVVEKGLLNRGAINRLAEAGTVEACVKLLTDAGYDGSLAQGGDFEPILANESERLLALMRELGPDGDALDVFLIKNDFHNSKTLIKAAAVNANGDPYLVPAWRARIDALRAFAASGDFSGLPNALAVAAVEASEAFAKTKNPQLIDLIMDKAAFARVSEAAKAAGEPLLEEYAAAAADIANIGAFLRLARRKRDAESGGFARAMVPGGSLGPDFFGKGDLIPRLSNTRYAALLKEVGDGADFRTTLTKLDRAGGDYLMALMRRRKNETLSIWPLIGYLYGKESEISQARLCATAIRGGVSADEIKERLRDCYA
jgi:V/A-type H+-transporting ATPase subunit C